MKSFDPNLLPELGFSQQENNLQNFLSQMKGLREAKLAGEVGPIDYEVSRKGLRLNGDYDNALAQLLVKLNGDMRFQASKPMWGGNLQFNAERKEGNPSFGIQYQRQF